MISSVFGIYSPLQTTVEFNTNIGKPEAPIVEQVADIRIALCHDSHVASNQWIGMGVATETITKRTISRPV
jgi:hypothetical protein